MQEAFLGEVNQATIRVLERNGYQVVIPSRQTCCGALQDHEGEHELTAELGKKNIDAFLQAGVDAVIVNAGGCAPVLKQYPALLRDCPDYAQRAETFRAMVRDISEFLIETGAEPPRGRVAARVTYSDSCHLRNEMGIVHQPRDLIRAIPGVEYVELSRPERCCGSAGIYNILQPQIANQILDEKLADIVSTGADTVVVTNPGCQLQIAAGVREAGLNVRVLHLVQLLDQAYAAEKAALDAKSHADP
jgi:glycolate oxidase iron-sulfur subunit